MLVALAWKSGDIGTFLAPRQQNYAKKNGIRVFLGETSDPSEEGLRQAELVSDWEIKATEPICGTEKIVAMNPAASNKLGLK